MTDPLHEAGVRFHTPNGSEQIVPVSGPELSKKVIDAGLHLGFARVGTASIADFELQRKRLEVFLERGYAGKMQYLRSPRTASGRLDRGRLESVLSGVQGVVAVAVPYGPITPLPRIDRAAHPETRVSPGYVAAYARGEDYHHVLKTMLYDLGDQIACLSGRSVRSRTCVDSAPLFERDIAVDAGLAFIGKNTLAIAPGLGSRFLLGELLVDIPLPQLAPPIAEGCGRCRACIDICPTGAFVDSKLLDASRCISYLTIELSGPIPRELRAKIGLHLFGCDLCQAVCPYNHGSHSPPPHQALVSGRFESLDLEELLFVGSGGFKRLVRGTALRRINREQFCRNLTIVMGNSGSSAYVPVLVRALAAHPYPLVKEHAAWALMELGSVHGVEPAAERVETLLRVGGETARLLSEERAARVA